MKSLGNFPDPFITEIAGQPDALRRAAAALTTQSGTLAVAAAHARDATIVFTGMGSSYDACYPAVNELARAGLPAMMLDAAELLHFRRAMLREGMVLIAVSQSGESAETVRLVETLRSRGGGPRVLSVTNGLANALADVADLTLDTAAGHETGPSTMTFAASLVALASVGRAFAGGDVAAVVEGLEREAELVAISIERLLADETLGDRIVERLDGRSTTLLLGRGAARAAAEMGALTIKEAVGMPVEALETGQFRHGPLELAGPDLAAIVYATEPETRDLDLDLLSELADLGAATCVVTAGHPPTAGALSVDIGPLDRALSPAASILPAQLLAWKLAVRRGREPGAYVHASKVTTRE